MRRILLVLLLVLLAPLAWAQQSPYTLYTTTCPAVMPVIQSCYDIDDFTLAFGTGTGSTTFLGMPSGTGTESYLARFDTGGAALENATLFNDPSTGNLGLRTETPATGMHLVGDSDALASYRAEGYHGSSGGVGVSAFRARGTAAAPAALQVNDIIQVIGQANGYVRNAADTATGFANLGSLRIAVNALDAQGRASAKYELALGPGVSASPQVVQRVTTSATNILLGELQTAGVRVGHNLSVYAAGTAYALTNTPALLDFGTTDPQLTINQPGTYLLHPRVALRYTAATFAANQTVTLLIQRTNNTPGAVANSTITLTTRILTTITDHMAVAAFPTLLYITANNNDALELQGSVSVVPSAGSLDAYEASLMAVRLY